MQGLASWLQTAGSLPVNVKLLFEGQEEVGPKSPMYCKDTQFSLSRRSVFIHTDIISGVTSVSECRLAAQTWTPSWSSMLSCSRRTMHCPRTAASSGEQDRDVPATALRRTCDNSRRKMQSHARRHPLVAAGSHADPRRIRLCSETEAGITIGLRGALGIEITHQTVDVDLHSG